jgi:two-component system OmpR family sensor kinase
MMRARLHRTYKRILAPTLFRSLLLWQLLVVSLVQSAVFGLSVWQLYDPRHGMLLDDQNLIAQAAARLIPQDADAATVVALMDKLHGLDTERSKLMQPDEFAWQVWRSDGELIARDKLERSLNSIPPGKTEVGIRVEGDHWGVVSAYGEGKHIWVVTGYAESYRDRLIHQVLYGMAVNFVIIWILILVALWVAARFGLRPLQKLGKRIRDRKRNDYSPLANERSDPLELRPLIAAIDEYSIAMQGLREMEHRFFADAAHELRTPLAVIGSQAHALAGEADPHARQLRLNALQNGVQRAANVLSNILMLARLDAMVAMPECAATDLDELVRACIESHALRAIEKGLDLGLEASEGVRASAHAPLLAVAVDNLIDNAIRYVPSGEKITLACKASVDTATIIIEDSGPGIAVEDRERVFARFERGQGASIDSTGSGLGLAIARDILRIMGGDLVLTATSGARGCRFEMTLRRQPSAAPKSIQMDAQRQETCRDMRQAPAITG